MENGFNSIEPLLEKLETYGRTSFELYKLKTMRKTAEVVSSVVSRAAVFIVLFMFVVFASIGLAIWLGDVLGQSYLGFLCVATFYILLGVVLFYFLHNFIKRKVSNSIISKIFKK